MANGEPKVAPILPDGVLGISVGEKRIEIAAEYVVDFRKTV